MPYDEGLAERIREMLGDRPALTEKRMFGGLCLLINGNMVCGITGEDLMVRVGPEGYDEALAEIYARPMDFTGKPMRGFVYVSPEGLEADGELERWVARGVEFAEGLPGK